MGKNLPPKARSWFYENGIPFRWVNFFSDFDSSVEFFYKVRSHLKVQSCKCYNSKYMIAATQLTNTEILAFIAVLVFKLLNRKALSINKKDNRNC